MQAKSEYGRLTQGDRDAERTAFPKSANDQQSDVARIAASGAHKEIKDQAIAEVNKKSSWETGRSQLTTQIENMKEAIRKGDPAAYQAARAAAAASIKGNITGINTEGEAERFVFSQLPSTIQAAASVIGGKSFENMTQGTLRAYDASAPKTPFLNQLTGRQETAKGYYADNKPKEPLRVTNAPSSR
jgi:hypothetical protein